MGSSRVTIWWASFSFNRSITEARVVDFPDPVGPVTRIIPFFTSVISRMVLGEPQHFKIWNNAGNQPKHGPHRGLGIKNIGPKPRQPLDRKRKNQVLAPFQIYFFALQSKLDK